MRLYARNLLKIKTYLFSQLWPG